MRQITSQVETFFTKGSIFAKIVRLTALAARPIICPPAMAATVIQRRGR